MEIFYIPSISVTIPTKFSSDQGEKNYITEIQQIVATSTMAILTDGSAQGNPGSGVIIKFPGHHSLQVKLAKAITSCGTSYEGEIKAIKSDTGYVFQNIGQANSLYIFTDSQSAMKTIMAQSRESYHNETITRDNLMQISSVVEHIKLIYCPAQIGIKDNEIADNLAKTASRKASHLPPRTDISLSKVKEINRQITLDKWSRIWENTNIHKYNQFVSALCKNSLV